MVDVIPFAQSAYTCPKLNCFYHKYSCRQVFRHDFPCEIRNWNKKNTHESIERRKKQKTQKEHDKAKSNKAAKNITIILNYIYVEK